MLAIGASHEEIAEVRAQDRAAQGITPDEEIAGERAVAQAEDLCGAGSRCPPAACPLRGGQRPARFVPGCPGYANLLIMSPDEVNFFGAGS